MGLMKTILISLMLLPLTSNSYSYAGWQSPVEIISGTWGSGPGQFFFGSGDTVDSFPRDFGVDSQGRLFVNDESNARIQVFTPGGPLEKIISAPQGINTALGWPYNIYVHPDGSLVASYDGPQKFFFDSSENLVKKVDVYGAAFPTSQGYFLEVTRTQYSLYSPTGQLIKTSTTRPLELGVVSEQYKAPGQYKVTVKYPDKQWTIVGAGVLPKYMRDTNGNLYGFGEVQVFRYTYCGKELAALTVPEKNVQEISRGPAVEPKVKVLEEYGSPVIAPNGDVYTWKRTPDKYSILKWTWVDDQNVPTGPDAPTGLTLMPSTTGIYLTWTASPQDPGCVTGYEISRATSAGGVTTTVATVDKGVVKYNDTTADAGTMYYYKVRAKAGSEYSNYTAEVSGKR